MVVRNPTTFELYLGSKVPQVFSGSPLEGGRLVAAAAARCDDDDSPASAVVRHARHLLPVVVGVCSTRIGSSCAAQRHAKRYAHTYADW